MLQLLKLNILNNRFKDSFTETYLCLIIHQSSLVAVKLSTRFYTLSWEYAEKSETRRKVFILCYFQ